MAFFTLSKLTLLPCIVLFVGILLSGYISPSDMAQLFGSRTSQPDPMDSTNEAPAMNRTPVYFLGHGGPNLMEESDHPAYKKLQEIGKEITTKVKPKAVVVFSAHWQGGRNKIQVNTAELSEMIYDFYGFPDHYYAQKFPHVGSREVAHKVLSKLEQAGIAAEPVERGLDHGVWVPFLVAFRPEENPLKVPIVQVSLYRNENPYEHYRLGEAVASLRDEGIAVIVSGMAVHNLRDYWTSMGQDKPMPYTVSFDEALKEAVTAPPSQRKEEMAKLLKRGDARMAHPSFEHLLPLHVGAGAAGNDSGKRLFTMHDGSMSWAQFRFGDVPEDRSVL